jgi:para-nitrobenzyl esterase
LQPRSALATNTIPDPLSEDCLHLNVYTPAADAARRPVFFWIHGGAFVVGSGGEAVYDGGRLAERGDVVVVTVNYRLGALGFSHWTEDERARLDVTSNAGSLDQVAALRWVRDNIETFGGNPECVTIAGESAGAFSVAMLLGMPAARGLFQRAITQSGARLTRHAGDPLRTTLELRRALGVSDQRLEELWDIPAERILASQQAVTSISDTGVAAPFAPVFDGETLPLPLEEAVSRGETAKVPLLIGTNRDELNLFMGPALKKLDEPIAEDVLIERLRAAIPAASEPQLRALFATYTRTREARRLPSSPRAILLAISSDALWRVPSARFAEAYLERQPQTFQYLFTYESPAMRGALRSCHGLELPFVFGTLDAPGQAQFAGHGEPLQRLSHRMMDSWLAFTRTGDPSVGGENQHWPAYELQTRPMMVLDVETALQHAPYEDERVLWNELKPRPLH